MSNGLALQTVSQCHVFVCVLESCLKEDRDVDCQPLVCRLRHPNSGMQSKHNHTGAVA